MGLIRDIRADKNFYKAIRTIILFFAGFFLLDMMIGNFLTTGLERYYGLRTNAEMALVGHSQTMLGLDKNLMEEKLSIKIAKYTREGVNAVDRQVMIKQLLKRNKNLQTVVYGVDAWLFTGQGLSKNSYTLFYPFMDESFISKYIKKHASLYDYITHKYIKTTRFNEQLISGAFRGYLKNWSNLKYGHVNIERLKKSIKNNTFREIKTEKENIELFIETLESLKENKIKVYLVYIPTIDLLNEAEPSKFKQTIQLFKSMETKFDNVTFINYLEPYSHDYKLFYDPIHLNPEGQLIITSQLILDLKESLHEDI